MNFRFKKYLAVTLTLLAIAHHCFAAGEASFQAGRAAYEAGQFDLAARAFSDSLVKQPAAGTLLNLGLAQWQQGRTGEAILAWERAAWLNPFDGNARNNLSYARETTSVNPLELTWCEQFSIWLPVNLWTAIAAGSLWLAVAMVTLPGFLRMPKAGWHQTVASLALGVFLLSLAPAIGIVTRAKIGIVIEKNTALRLTPTQAAEVIAALPPGEPVRELRQRGNYLFVHTQNGNGWVERRQVEFLVSKVK